MNSRLQTVAAQGTRICVKDEDLKLRGAVRLPIAASVRVTYPILDEPDGADVGEFIVSSE